MYLRDENFVSRVNFIWWEVLFFERFKNLEVYVYV